MKNSLKSLAALCLGIVVSIVVAEMLISKLGVVDTPPGMLMPSDTRSFKHRPNFRGRDRFGNILKFNSFGLRDKEYSLEKGNDVYRILVLGDSVAFGDGVKTEDTFAERLEIFLSNDIGNKTVEVLNSGVRGYNTYQELLLLKEVGVAYDPDLVIVAYVLNDAEPFSRQRGLINPKYKLLIKIKNSIRRYSYLYAYLRRSLEVLRHRATPQKFVEKYDDQFFVDSLSWKASRDSLKSIRNLSKEKHFELLLAVLPRLEGLRHSENYPPQKIHDQIVRAGHELNIDTLDLLPIFKGNSAEDLRITPSDTFHPTPEGHDIIARALAKHIREVYPDYAD